MLTLAAAILWISANLNNQYCGNTAVVKEHLMEYGYPDDSDVRSHGFALAWLVGRDGVYHMQTVARRGDGFQYCETRWRRTTKTGDSL